MAEKMIGRYEIQGELGRGAMGLVYKAYDPILERHAAIKVMTTSGEIDDELRVRFFREARSAARLSNPHIIAIFDMGDDQNRPFIAMEFVEGEDLKALIRQRVFVPFARKLDIIAQICRALDYAHRHGVIHRDIKPGNVRLTPEGLVKILDFGLARLGASDMTRTGTLMGTPYYMSPEQAKGAREIDGRSDLFSVGVIFYEFLCYRRPFEAESPTAVCYQIIAEPHSPLSAHLPGCDAELEAILDKALAKDPAKRFTSGEEMAAALSAFAAQLPNKEKALSVKVAEIESEVERQRAEAQRHPLYSLLDPALLDDTISPQLSGAALPQMPAEEGQNAQDYGLLLHRKAQLEKTLQSMARDLEKIRPLVEAFEQCKRQLEAEEWDDCLVNVRQMLKSFPRNPQLLAMEQQCTEAIAREDQKQKQLRQLVGEVRQALATGDAEDAAQKAEQALALDPECTEALQLRDEALRLGKLQQAQGLLVEAKDTCRRGRFDDSRGLIDKALALAPDNTEVKALREKVETLESLIRQASGSLERGAFEEALEIAGHALVVDPEQPAPIEIRKTAGEMLERRNQLRKMREEAEGLLSEGRYEACVEVCRAALKLGGENGGFRRLEKQALSQIKKQKQADELLAKARELLGDRDFEQAARQARAVLELIPESAEARDTLEQAEQGNRNQERLTELLGVARGLVQAKRWSECLDFVAEGRRLEPGNQELVELERHASQSLDRQRQVEKLCSEAAGFLHQGDNAAALKVAEQALALNPESHNAAATAGQARAELERQRRLKTLVNQARTAYERQDFETSRALALEGLALAGDHQELRQLLSDAEQGLTTQRLVAKLLEEGRANFENQRFTDVIRVAREIFSLSPRHSEALALEKKANEAIREAERRARIESRRAAARDARQATDAAACLKAAIEGLTDNPADREFLDLRAWAERILQEQRAEEERQARIARLLATARQELSARRLRRARRRFNDLLQLEPAHTEARAAKAEVDRILAAQSHTRTRHVSFATAGLIVVGGLIWLWRGSDVPRVLSDAPATPVTVQDPQPKKTPPPPSVAPRQPEEKSVGEEALARKLDDAKHSLEAKDFATADRLATEALALSDQDATAREIQKQARTHLAEVTRSKEHVRELVAAGKYSDAQAALKSLQQLSTPDNETQELSRLIETASRQEADSARAAVDQARQQAGKSAAQTGISLAPAQRLEGDAAGLYQSGDYAASAAKFHQARDAYLELDKKAAEILQGRQTESEKQSALSAKRSFDDSRAAAEQANADSLASGLYSRAKAAAANADLKLQQGDFDGAKNAYQDAGSLMVQAVEAAKKAGETARAARRSDDEAAGQKQLAQESQRRLTAARQDFAGEDAIAAGEESRAQQLLKEGRWSEATAAFDSAARRYQANKSASVALDRMITSYATAFSEKDLKTLRSLWPGMDQSNLESFRSTFQINEAISLSFTPVRFSFDDQQAVVVCRAELSLMPKGEKRQVSRSSDSATFTMARSGNSWVIQSFVGNFRSK